MNGSTNGPTNTDLHTLSGAYAVDALSPEEADLFRTHLASCPACRVEVRELQDAAARMGASEAAAPPPHLKARVMAAADRQPQLPPRVPEQHQRRAKREDERRSPRWLPRVLAAAAAVVLIAAGGFGISQLQQEQAPENTLAAPVSQVFDAADAHQATMETSNGGRISVATSPSLGKMAVDTDELPGLDQGHVYQLWAVADGEPASVGLLEEPERGAAMDMPDEGVAVAITIEPAGGSDQPTTEPIMSVVPSEV